jgi:riboflavin biosynthesis pyrimidine reductase
MTRPYILCHMATSLDGRTLLGRWAPQNQVPEGLFDRLHTKLGGDAWLIGRTTGQEYAKRDRYPGEIAQSLPRETWIAQPGAKAYGVVLDAHGKIAWGRADIGDDPIVVVLTEAVPDAHLQGLRDEGVSYIFAGREAIDLALALQILHDELDIRRLIVEGGGITNGAFLRAGLVDELSLMLFPAIDGRKGAPSLFESAQDGEGAAPLSGVALTSCDQLDGGVLWLRYAIQCP